MGLSRHWYRSCCFCHRSCLVYFRINQGVSSLQELVFSVPLLKHLVLDLKILLGISLNNSALFSVKPLLFTVSSWPLFCKEKSQYYQHQQMEHFIQTILCFVDILFSGLASQSVFLTCFAGMS